MAGKKTQKPDLRTYLASWPVGELIDYVLDLAGRYPEVARELHNQQTVKEGTSSDLIRELRKELETLEEVDYEDYDEGYGGGTPDLGHLRTLLKRIQENGENEALLLLIPEIIRIVNHLMENQQECENDDELKECVSVLFRAIEASGRTDTEKLLTAIDLDLADEYDLCEEESAFFEADWPAAAWSAVADRLTKRLQGLAEGGWSRRRFVDWVQVALHNAGRKEEVISLLEEETPRTGDYLGLIHELLQADRRDDARAWILRGLTARDGNVNTDGLRDAWRKMAEADKDWATAAAVVAEEFLARPGVEGLQALQKAAKKAKCETEVRAAALGFLETGQRPAFSRGAAAPAGKGLAWPLPELPEPLRATTWAGRYQESGPHLGVLVELAIAEKRPDDVLRWFDQLRESQPHGTHHGLEDSVAEAVADRQSDRALAIYRSNAERNINQVTVSGYQAALPYLRKLKKVLKQHGRTTEWAAYLKQLREANQRRPRMLEVLDKVEGER